LTTRSVGVIQSIVSVWWWRLTLPL